MGRDYDAGLIVMVMGALGVIMAYIFYTMNENGVIIDEMITGSVTISDVMAATIIFFILVGLILGVRR